MTAVTARFAYAMVTLSSLVLAVSVSYGQTTDPRPPAVSSPDTARVQRASSGEFNRRKRALQLRSTLLGQAGTSSTGAPDTTRYVADTTARIEQFVHVRRDPVNALEEMDTPHPLYVPGPSKAAVRAQLDTATWMYTVRYLLGADDIRTPVVLPFEDYVSLRLDYAVRRNWEQILQSSAVQYQRKQGLGELFGKVTNIEIPVPKNPIFSIFGPNIIRLQINGRVDIHAAFRNTKNDQFVNSPLGQTRNEPDFNQEVQINLRGEIGDKLNISADWNTQRTFEYENQLKVQYKGYEDEIVQSVQAGNVSLPTSSSFIPPSQALFGILAKFQFGPLKLTTVASQKKGQIKELSVSGGARPTPFNINPTNYSKDHYFIDTSYISLYEDIFLRIPALPNPNVQIQEIEVWITNLQAFDPRKRKVVAFLDQKMVLDSMNSETARTADWASDPGRIEAGEFIPLEEGTDYTYNSSAGIITINRSLQRDHAVAVAYTVQGSPSSGPVQIGNFGSRDTATSKFLVMKLVRPKNLDPQFETAWRMLVKNRYPLGGRGIKKEGFEFNVEYTPPGGTALQNVLPQNVNLLEMFGLDRYNEAGVAGQDQVFDYIPGVTIDESRAEVIFPTVEPFRAGAIEKVLLARGFSPDAAVAAADSFAFPAIYDTTYNGAINDQRNRFAFVGTITPSTASSYNLGFNIVEGSVEVLVDNQPATPNVDYTVDYITGVVNIRNQSLLVPGKNLQIRYEANDLFQLASKSLLGARGELALSKEANLGFTILNLNQQSLSDKVRLGEEPISNTIMGFDGGVQFETPGLTRALNWLPGIQTLAASSISLKGEAAYMSPDPNTRKSPIPQDGGQGIAYIDDFEGARRIIPLGVASTAWKEMGLPFVVLGLDPFVPGPGRDSVLLTNDPVLVSQLLSSSEKMAYKGKASWFNVANSDVFVQDIWGDRRSVSRREEQVQVLNLFFRPRERGMFNTSLAIDSTVRSEPWKAWGGMHRLLSTTATNLLDENISFVEMWLNVVDAAPGTRLNIDLGYVTEDVIPNGQLDTEDGLDGGIRNGILNPLVEDVGIDGIPDAEERIRFADFVNKYPEYSNDPSGDNWRRIPTVLDRFFGIEAALGFEGYNGSENSRESDLGSRFPDTEDLNGNNILDRINSYYEYELPLDTLDPGFRRFVVGGGQNGWYQIRIPLNKYARQIGTPTFANIEGIRVWMTGASSEALIRITEFNLVGNQWEELVKNDATFKVSTVNFEDNPDYQIPPGVRRERDRTRPDEEIYGNEQSLNLVLTNVPDGQTRQAIKRFPLRPLDLFNYKVMKMFIHGDATPTNGFSTTGQTANVFVRFGADSLNYYEYSAPVWPGWDPRNDMTIRFSDLSAIKLLRDSARGLTLRYPVEGGPPGATYQIRGEPTLRRITYITIGVENPENQAPSFLSGEVWVNELRLTEVDDTPGWAYRFDTQVRLADVASVQFSLQNRDPFFHGLEERFGSLTNQSDWNLSASVAFERFLPESWKGTSLGFSYSHVENIRKPRYMPGTDILVEEAAQQVDRDTSSTRTRTDATGEDLRVRTQELSVTETYSIPSIRLNVPVQEWWMTETINRMTFGFSYTQNSRRSPTVEFSNSWSWNARFAYALPFGPNNYLSPLSPVGDFFLFSPWKETKVYYLPKQISFGTTFTRNQARSQARNQTQQNPVTRNFSSSRNLAFTWQLVENGLLSPALDYQLSISSNLTHLETDRFGNQRSFSDILNSLFLGDRLISFGNDIQYSQTVNVSTRPRVPTLLSLDKVLSPSIRYNVRYGWSRNLQAGELGRTADWSNNISLGTDVNIKTLGDAIWPAAPAAPQGPADTVKHGLNPLEALETLLRVLLKEPVFGFERFNISYTQSNRSQNSGILGRPGFGNMFSRVPFFQSSLPENGPSLLYQLGLSTDPHGDVTVGTKGTFPFIRGNTNRGLRAPNGNLTDVFSQSNKISMRTSRRLWTGAQLDLTWNLGWSYNSNSTLITDSLGVPTVRSRTISGDVDRSFMTFPSVFVFKLFNTGVEDVYKRFDELQGDRADERPDETKVAQAFEEGLEAFPFLTKLLGGLLPRANWSFRLDGLENLPLFESIASRVSLDHAYSSNFRRRWRIAATGQEVTEGETVTFGFAPLIGLNFTFKGVTKGTLGAQFRYSTNTSYDLSPSIQNIVEANTEEISVTANFSRQGFEFPLFGLSLSNDVQASLSYTYSRNGRKLFDLKQQFKEEGQPLEGSSRTTIEPRIRYILSSRVTASLYYRYVKTAPDAAGSKITGQTVNEGGLDINVAIQ